MADKQVAKSVAKSTVAVKKKRVRPPVYDKPGRPPDDGVKKTKWAALRCTPETFAYLSKVGGGNFSAGVHLLMNLHKTKQLT